jgi:hypothetical protein
MDCLAERGDSAARCFASNKEYLLRIERSFGISRLGGVLGEIDPTVLEYVEINMIGWKEVNSRLTSTDRAHAIICNDRPGCEAGSIGYFENNNLAHLF